MAEKRPDRTLGANHDEFWAWCEKGELRIQQCGQCKAYTWPPAETCEACDSSALGWQAMSGIGKIASWCTFERDYYYGVLPMPWDTIVVELQEGPLFLSNPQGFSWPDIQVGMPVSLEFIECEDSAGTFRLPVFSRVV